MYEELKANCALVKYVDTCAGVVSSTMAMAAGWLEKAAGHTLLCVSRFAFLFIHRFMVFIDDAVKSSFVMSVAGFLVDVTLARLDRI